MHVRAREPRWAASIGPSTFDMCEWDVLIGMPNGVSIYGIAKSLLCKVRWRGQLTARNENELNEELKVFEGFFAVITNRDNWIFAIVCSLATLAPVKPLKSEQKNIVWINKVKTINDEVIKVKVARKTREQCFFPIIHASLFRFCLIFSFVSSAQNSIRHIPY